MRSHIKRIKAKREARALREQNRIDRQKRLARLKEARTNINPWGGLVILLVALLLTINGSFINALASDVGTELIEKRTQNSKTTYLGGVQYALDSSVGAIHYYDDGWQEIDNIFEPAIAPWDWQMLKAGYHVRVKEDFTSGQILEFEKKGETVHLQPMALEWTNDLDMIQTVSMPQSSIPTITNPVVDLLPAVSMPSHQGTIRWNNAYGSGIDFEWRTTATKLLKTIIISDLTDLPLPEGYILAGLNPTLRYNLIFAPSSGVDIFVDGALWDKQSKRQTFSMIEFKKGGEVLWGFMPLQYWDSDGNEGQSVATIEKKGKSLYISIRVPYEWLQTAVYPVFIDVDVDEDVTDNTDDCYITGADIFTGKNYEIAGWSETSGWIFEAGWRFQTVAIPNAATIDTAYINCYTEYNNLNSQPVEAHVWGEDVDDAATFSTRANFVGRGRTTANIDWTIANGDDSWHQSPEIKTIIQEIVDRGGWATGQDMVVFIKGEDEGVSRAFYAMAVEDAFGNPAHLHIEYSAGVVKPTVTTQAATSVEDTTATGNGNITATGGENCDKRGVVWDDATHGDPGDTAPDLTDYVTAGGGYTSENGSFGTGAFTASMTGLWTGTTIYYRAWAHNSAGYAYGAEVTFLTKPAAPTNVSATDGVHENKVVITWTKSTGATDYHVWRDAVDLGAAGDVATWDDNGATAATITNAGTASASDGTSTAHVTLSLAGEATGTTSHNYKVVASNATGDSDDSAIDAGYRGVGAITYQWQVDQGGGFGNIAGGTTDPYNYTLAGAPTITAGNASASDGTSAAHVTLSVAGESGNNGSTWDYQCVVSASGASNSPQTSTSDTGYRGTDSLTYEWFRSAADADAAYATIAGEGGTTDPFNDTNGVVDPDGRWYYCEIGMADAVSQDTTHDRGYKSAAPIYLTATYIGPNQIDLAWNPPAGSVGVTIRGKVGEYPTSETDGYDAYTGALAVASDTSQNFDNIDEVYYCGYSDDGLVWTYFGQDKAGGIGMILLALVVLAVGLSATMFITKKAVIGYMAAIGWAILGAYAYTESTTPWGDWQFFLAFASLLGGVFLAIYGAFALREKRDTYGDDEIEHGDGGLLGDGGGRGSRISRTKKESDDDMPDWDKVFGYEDEDKVWGRSKALHDRASARREALHERAKQRRGNYQ